MAKRSRLQMPLLDIDVRTFNKSNEKSKQDALDIAEIQVKDRAYVYLGISYIFLDENLPLVVKHDLISIDLAPTIEILINLQKEKANMTKEQLAVYDAFTEDKDNNERRIDFQIRGKIDSFSP